MMGKYYSLFIFYLSLYSSCFGAENNQMAKLLKDFLLLQKAPPKISLFLCWKNDEALALLKQLHREHFYVSLMNSPHREIPVVKPTIKQLFVLDLNCSGYPRLLHQANARKLFQLPYEWILLADEAPQIPNGLEIFTDSKFYIFGRTSSSAFYAQAIFKVSLHPEFWTNDIALWEDTLGFRYYNQLTPSRNRTNLWGVPLNISIVITNNDSLNHLTDYRDKHIDGVSKLNYIFINDIADTLNVTRSFIIRDTWGYLDEKTKIYSGIIGDVQTGLSEIAGTPAFITADRLEYLDYINPTVTKNLFIFRKPPLSYVQNVYILPFDKMVWFTSFALIGLIAIVLYTIVKWEWVHPENYGLLVNFLHALRPRFFDVILMELGAICQQGAEAEPRSGAGRIATLSVFVALMFLYTSYSANIVALLQSTSDSIRTLDDLLYSKIKLGVVAQPYSYYWFPRQTEKIRKAIYTQKVAPKGQKPNFMEVEAGIRRMRDEFFAFHVETTSGYKVVAEIFQESEKCSLREIDYWNQADPTLSMKKNSSYKELFKVGFRKMLERGIQSREFRKLYTKKPLCQSQTSIFKNIGLDDCYYPFLIFALGTGCAVVFFVLECICKKKFGRRSEESR